MSSNLRALEEGGGEEGGSIMDAQGKKNTSFSLSLHFWVIYIYCQQSFRVVLGAVQNPTTFIATKKNTRT